jgi:hypothetical protein
VKESIEKYKMGQLKESIQPSVTNHFGAGRGMGRGRGSGRMRGREMRENLPTSSQPANSNSDIDTQKPDEELSELQDYKKRLEEDLEGLNARIQELKDSKETKTKK